MALGQLAITPHEHRAVAGDDWRLGVTLYNNGSVVNLTGATVQVQVLDANEYAMVAATSQSSGTTGADWTNGILVIAIPAASTGTFMRDCMYYLRVIVTQSGVVTTWPRVPVFVEASAF